MLDDGKQKRMNGYKSLKILFNDNIPVSKLCFFNFIAADQWDTYVIHIMTPELF